MSELSTRVWLDERLWETVRGRAIAEGTTVRELIPRLVKQGVSPRLVPAVPPAPAAVSRPAPPGPPVVALSETYRCDECGAEVRLGGLSNHLGKHLKERQAPQAERS